MIDPYLCPACGDPMGFARADQYSAFFIVHPGWPDCLVITDEECAENLRRGSETVTSRINHYVENVHAPEAKQN